MAASEEQLRQAYGDRIVQLPRREYSQAAITSRRNLIAKATISFILLMRMVLTVLKVALSLLKVANKASFHVLILNL
jgi:hypothetical protein